jgi:hypothetical protein
MKHILGEVYAYVEVEEDELLVIFCMGKALDIYAYIWQFIEIKSNEI